MREFVPGEIAAVSSRDCMIERCSIERAGKRKGRDAGASRPGVVFGIARLANADEAAARRADGAMTGVANTPRLALAAPDATAGDAAAMAVRAAAAKSRSRRDSSRHIDRDESESEEGCEKFVHVSISLGTARYRPVRLRGAQFHSIS